MIVTHAQELHTRLANVSTGRYISALGESVMTSKYNSKELVPVLVRRILGFNRAKYSVKKQELKPV